ncbi:MAG: lipoyl(octanoyl) transferase LipB [Roseibium sp.]|uniref:lipoyl(octanoyl) transferase LipB n=1 Tax=Roseibium sp. TaxID=1936156 RepID=UPI001B0C03C2|nr:lipoyl(octanoyl) transferase LipB [Roseibium sp.]MBO6894349.1 lipoyl(octanoyl) transferase LipB [Roseibium sp.]MBO6932373.1 lipoyl(octanoyl) transferase LipB [Roseibium sp.]
MSRDVRNDLSFSFLPKNGSNPVDWKISDELVDYETALAEMDARVEGIISGEANEMVWLLEHPPLYTAGKRADDSDLVAPDRFPVYRTGRGGQHTYHGPGQRVAYVMLDLKRRHQDVRAFVAALEAWLINTLWHYHIRGERREDRVGVWVQRPERGKDIEDKVAAIGIRLRRWVTFHGISFNVEPDLEHFSGIVPCGVQDHGVTSLVDLGIPVTMAENDSVLRAEFEKIFGQTSAA